MGSFGAEVDGFVLQAFFGIFSSCAPCPLFLCPASLCVAGGSAWVGSRSGGDVQRSVGCTGLSSSELG